MSKMILIDDEGENQAVRMFLALYGGACGVTSEQMRKHLTMAGFDGAWPEWANSNNGHLTKAGAQLWIRHLFALEQPAQPQHEPVATVCSFGDLGGTFDWASPRTYRPPVGAKLYASPPAQQQEPVALEQERKAFEEWIDSGFINKGHAAFHKFSDRDAYCIDEIQNKWKAWKERAKRTTPQAQRKPWVGLTDEERKRAIQFNNAHEALAVVIEAKLKEKNT